MSKTKLNEQEQFWSGNFGNKYIDRNNENKIIESNKHLFLKIKKHLKKVKRLIEFGCNIGLNLKAINLISSKIELTGVDINKKAINQLNKNKKIKSINSSIINFENNNKYDFVLIKGVLIHINPKQLRSIYDKIYKISDKYIYIAEYYSPEPMKISYRGHSNKLFKRDFAGEMLDIYRDLRLVDYGFAYHKDKFKQDDLNWFLLKKK